MCSANVEPSGDWKEARRMRAWELVPQGWQQQDVAAALGVSKGAVSQWASRARAGGIAALRRRKPPGGVPQLGAPPRAQLPTLRERGPAACGFAGEIWTLGRVAQVIRQEFGVSYHPTQVGRILKDCGWSWQKPTLRSAQRDAAAIPDWRENRFAELKKTP